MMAVLVLCEFVCQIPRVVIIDQGKIVADDTVDGLKKIYKESSFEVIFRRLTKGQ